MLQVACCGRECVSEVPDWQRFDNCGQCSFDQVVVCVCRADRVGGYCALDCHRHRRAGLSCDDSGGDSDCLHATEAAICGAADGIIVTFT